MARYPFFLDDQPVASALDQATDAALDCLTPLFPDLEGRDGGPFRRQLRQHLAAMLTGHASAPAAPDDLPRLVHGADAFGDPFALEDLKLPRAGSGYAVQLLDTDTLLDRASGKFLAVRDPDLDGLFDTFENARQAARQWLSANGGTVDLHPLAIVPALYDSTMGRHVLIYGVLPRQP